MTISATVIIVTHNHRGYIEECLKSITSSKSLEIIVIDNQSTDKTPEFVEKCFPNVKLIKNPKNTGYGAANNIGAKLASNEHLIILNPDTMLDQDSIDHLLKPLAENPNIITIPKVLIYNGEMINTCGNKQHFTGMAFTRGANEKPEDRNSPRFVNGLSGVCFTISKENFMKLGGFDENIFLYMEDSEFSWRVNAAGLKIFYVPEAVIYHDYDFKVTPKKIYYVEKGRYIILRKYLSWKEYILLSPSLLMTEILTGGYAILNGPKGIIAKLKGSYEGLTIDVDKIDSNREILLSNMNTRIPELEFNFSKIFSLLRTIANFTYKKNRRLLE
ncbi:glycosyltransferase family 2 protein [Methanobacterium formicicum]|uniref:Glycosyltransferase n=1 Tax=Methanobacterium formicicum (strain DSM 3637 / PP1) TaxID=1204725 RepID=K2RDE9_METFP|nr:glycosyltransferase family 2 protein [Methanobacterium formicicum]EKF86354.1 glycosyltransferase [Methanobacterium formicicum DSM 3637]